MKKIITNIFIISILIVLQIQCSDRKHENPLDPLNPLTNGKPQGLKIFSKFDAVTISWDFIPNENIEHYNIYRKQNIDPLFKLLTATSSNTDYYIDNNVHYNNTYTYQISTVTTGYESPLSDSVSITPGPTIVWVTDAYNYSIIKLSADCIHQIQRISTSGYPWSIVINPDNDTFWYSDLYFGAIYHIANNKNVVYSTRNQWWQPVSITLEHDNNTLWAADTRGKIIRIKPDMTSPVTELKHENIKEPTSIVIDESRNICWAADSESNKVFRFSSSDTLITALDTPFLNPKAVAINNTDGSCYVADSTRIIKLNYDGTFHSIVTNNLHNAHVIEVNQNTHEIWVVDWGSNENDSKVIKYDQNGTKIFKIDNFNVPKCIKVNLSNNGCIVADSNNQRIVKISSQGDIISINNNFYFPVGIDIEYANNFN